MKNKIKIEHAYKETFFITSNCCNSYIEELVDYDWDAEIQDEYSVEFYVCMSCNKEVDFDKCNIYNPINNKFYVPEPASCGFCNGTGEVELSMFYKSTCHICNGIGTKKSRKLNKNKRK